MPAEIIAIQSLQIQLKHHNSENYVLLASISGDSGRCVDVAKMREMMKDKALKISTGCSWIEINRKVYQFLVEHVSHLETGNLCNIEKLGLADGCSRACSMYLIG